MPWNADQFRKRHNRKLAGAAASKAAEMATAMVREGMPEGRAIAIANKKGDQMMTAKVPTRRQKALYDRAKR